MPSKHFLYLARLSGPTGKRSQGKCVGCGTKTALQWIGGRIDLEQCWSGDRHRVLR